MKSIHSFLFRRSSFASFLSILFLFVAVLPTAAQSAGPSDGAMVARNGISYFFAASCATTPNCTQTPAPIQAAVDYAADNETLTILPGTYTEQILVNGKNGLVIQGAGGGMPLLLANGKAAPINEAIRYSNKKEEPAKPLIVIRSGSVTIRNLELDGANGKVNAAIYASDANLTVNNSRIHGAGIGVFAASRTANISVALDSNQIYANLLTQVSLVGQDKTKVLTAAISNNTITGTGKAAANTDQGGIYTWNNVNTSIEFNLIMNNYDGVYITALWHSDFPSNNHQVHFNSIINNYLGALTLDIANKYNPSDVRAENNWWGYTNAPVRYFGPGYNTTGGAASVLACLGKCDDGYRGLNVGVAPYMDPMAPFPPTEAPAVPAEFVPVIPTPTAVPTRAPTPTPMVTATQASVKPVVIGFSPAQFIMGSAPEVKVTISGSNFSPASQVRWSGLVLPTTFINNQTLQVNVKSQYMFVGSLGVDVKDRTQTSNYQTFNVLNPMPTITGVTPGSVKLNTSVTIRVTGKNFMSGVYLTWNSHYLATKLIDSMTLEATVPANFVTTITTSVSKSLLVVSNPSPSVSPSVAFSFIVTR